MRAPTRAGYRQMLAKMAVHLFYWNLMLTMDIPSMTPERKAALDKATCDFCGFSFFKGGPGSLGRQLSSALSGHWPEDGRAGSCPLSRFFRARPAWRRLAPRRTRCPCPLPHIVLVVVSLFKSSLASIAA